MIGFYRSGLLSAHSLVHPYPLLLGCFIVSKLDLFAVARTTYKQSRIECMKHRGWMAEQREERQRVREEGGRER